MPKEKTTTKKAAKKIDKKPAAKKTPKPQKPPKEGRFFEGTGRRKTSLARVRLFTEGDKSISINGKDMKDYFTIPEMQEIIVSPLEKTNALSSYRVSVKVQGGGVHSQAEAVRHGVARALVLFNPELRSRLRDKGFLTRDSRMRERKKFGLKRARRAPQWRKR